MKTYLVFAYDDSYPFGGMEDLQHVTTDEAEARATALTLRGKRDTVELWAVEDGLTEEIMWFWIGKESGTS